MSLLSCSAVPGLGSLIGSVGTDSMLQTINDEMANSGYFGSSTDMFNQYRQNFIQAIVEPFRMIGNTIKDVVGKFDYDDRYMIIDSEEKLEQIPMCMQLPILQYEPVRKLFDEGRIFGFGYENIPEGDAYGRLINNGYVADVAEVMNAKGEFTLSYHFESDDPELTFDEQDAIRETREWLDRFMRESDRDFTDPLGNSIG